VTTAIKTFIAGWNDRAHPFVWTKTADQILKKANRQPTSNTDHSVKRSASENTRSMRAAWVSTICLSF
jgi:hypothetical protein